MPMKSNNILGIIIIGVIVYFVFIGGDKWMGFYYPDENDLTKHIQSSEFNSLEECRGWVKDQARVLNPEGKGFDYECGKNCRLAKPSSLYHCKETTY